MRKLLSFLWSKADGKKTNSGLLVTAVGIGCFFFEATKDIAKELVIAGLSLSGFGGAHKVVKSKRKGETK